MKEIGGYFELELHKGQDTYHNASLMLKSGRSALHYILNHTKATLVYLPYYTCNALLEPFQVSGVPYKFYEVNEQLEPVMLPQLKEHEYFLYVNYFDLKRRYSEYLSDLYGHKLIVDCSQAFFMKGNGKSWFFNSCRKFFGTPDGSYLYAPDGEALQAITALNENYITDHLLKRFNGHTAQGYSYFSANEAYCDSSLLAMSKFSRYLLSGVDYKNVIERRRANYEQLRNHFAAINKVAFKLDDDMVPMMFPLLPDKIVNKQEFYKKNIFIPSLWNDVFTRENENFNFEKEFVKKLIPIPIDHRYSDNDMNIVINELSKHF